MITIGHPYIPNASIKYINKALRENKLSINYYNKKVEEMLVDITGCKYNILTNSGTSALDMVFALFKNKCYNIEEVVVPNNLYVAPYNMASRFFKIHSIDSDLATWNMLYESIPMDSKLILIAHNLGNPTNIAEIRKRFPNSVIVEDNCEGIFGKYINYKGEQVSTGSLSDCSVLSFYANKNITSGEGGCFSTNKQEYYEYALSYATQGMSSKRYIHNMMACNYRMTNIQAALLLGQLENKEKIIEKRSWVFSMYNKYLDGIPNIYTQKITNNFIHSNWMFGLYIINNMSYENADAYFTEKGIETRPLFYPINYHKHFSYMPLQDNAKILSNKVVLFPTHHYLKEREIKYICECIYEFIDKED